MSGDDPRVDRYLRGLPREAPDAALESQVLARHLRRRRLRKSVPLALAAMLVLGVVSWQAMQPARHSASPAAPQVPSEALAELRALDRALQEGYLVGMSSAELDRLWQRRAQAAEGLAHPSSADHEVRL